MLKILVDENIPYAEEAFSGFGKVKLAPGREISNKMLKDIDVLIIRSVTKVNKSLIERTPVTFVGTTTIGLDHINTSYLESNKISFANSPGCNADSVAEYIFAGLLKIASEQNFCMKDKSIGIIGYGNIGRRVSRIARGFGMSTFINDPPLQRETKDLIFVSYKEALLADIITFHVPLNMRGIDKTYHMLSAEQLNYFDNKKIIINAARGSVISEDDLRIFLLNHKNTVVLDVWENEPLIDTELLKLVNIASAHVAGYSYEGKVNGTIMIYKALCKFLNIEPGWKPSFPRVENSILDYPEGLDLEEALNKLISGIYNIDEDDKKLRKIYDLEKNDQGRYFDYLRKNYQERRELPNYTVRIKKHMHHEITVLDTLRFKLIQE